MRGLYESRFQIQIIIEMLQDLQVRSLRVEILNSRFIQVKTPDSRFTSQDFKVESLFSKIYVVYSTHIFQRKNKVERARHSSLEVSYEIFCRRMK